MLGLFYGLIHKIINAQCSFKFIVYLKWKMIENTTKNGIFKEQNDIITINYCEY